MLNVIGDSRRHLDAVGESYWAHQRFATRVGLAMMGAGVAAVIHGLAPFLFQSTGSRTIKRLSAFIEHRGPAGVQANSGSDAGLSRARAH